MIKKKIILGMLVGVLLVSYQAQAMQSIASIFRFAVQHRRLTMTVVGITGLAIYAYRHGYYPFARKTVAPALQTVGFIGLGHLTHVVVSPNCYEPLGRKKPVTSALPKVDLTHADNLPRVNLLDSNGGASTIASSFLPVQPGNLTQSQNNLVTPPLTVQVRQVAGNTFTTLTNATTTVVTATKPFVTQAATTALNNAVPVAKHALKIAQDQGYNALNSGAVNTLQEYAVQGYQNAKTQAPVIAGQVLRAVQQGADAVVTYVRNRRNSDPYVPHRDDSLDTSFVNLGTPGNPHVQVPSATK